MVEVVVRYFNRQNHLGWKCMSSSTLNVDSKRDATDSIRGYVYQAYQSVLAWMTLDPEETLVLEGAEDFDIYGSTQVTVTQVKDLSKNITLKSSSVTDALNNFWTHCARNPGQTIQFRFLSTASSGREKGTHFGSSCNGLDYWESAARGTADVTALRSFLLMLGLEASLTKFIKDATDADLRDKLLVPIKWDLGSKPIDPLQYAIEGKLIVHGGKFGVNTHHSSSALAHLLKRVADLLSTEGLKVLSYADFLRSFDEVTMESIPRGELDALKNRSPLYQLAGVADASKLSQLTSRAPTITPPLPLVHGVVSRQYITQELAETAKRQGLLFLHGGSGMGKTNLAALLAIEISSSFGWCGFRGLSGPQTRDALERANFEFNALRLPPYLVLDDLDFRNASQFERELISLIFNAKSAGGVVLTTSPSAPPTHLFPKFWVDEKCQALVVPFQEADISEMLKSHGLSDPNDINLWSRIIFLTTSGHPQLVHARVRNLQARDWPKPDMNDLLKPDDVEKVRNEARQRLVQELPSQNTRVLAYRLSLITGSFSRDTAISLAGTPPPIKMPGEAFDTLIGPWVEQEENNRFRVSPLLTGAANENLTLDEINAVHEKIAVDFLTRGSINQYEIGTALMHAILAKSVAPILKISLHIVGVAHDDMKHLTDAMVWLPMMALESDQSILPDQPDTELYLRLAQYKLASSSGKSDEALKIINHIEHCLQEIEIPELKQTAELLAYGIILNTIEIHIPSSRVVSLLSRMIDLFNSVDTFEEIREKFSFGTSGLPKVGDNLPTQVLFSYQAVRVNGTDDLVDLLDALDILPIEKRQHLLGVCVSDDDFAGLLIGRAWWKEAESGSLNVDKVSWALRKTISKALEWECAEIARAAYVALSVVADEYEHSVKKALDIIEEGLNIFPNEINLLNQKAKVLFHTGDHRGALDLSKAVIEHESLSSIERTFTIRSSGISAAKLGDWKQAEELFLYGVKVASESEFQRFMALGLKADAAFARWMKGDTSSSLELFSDVLSILKEVPLSEDLVIRHLHATVSHTIAWIYKEVLHDNSDSIFQPLPGMCSNPDTHEKMKDLSIKDISTIWQLLAKTEKILGVDVGIQNKSHEATGGKCTLILELATRSAEFDAIFKNGKAENFVPAYVRMIEPDKVIKRIDSEEIDLWSSEEIPPLPDDYWNDTNHQVLLHHFMLKAAITSIADDAEQALPIVSWRSDLSKYGGIPDAIEWFLRVLEGEEPTMEGQEQAAAGVLVVKSKTPSPVDLWVALFRILNAVSNDHKFVANALEAISTKHWLYAVKNQRFAFVIPDLVCPSIENACKSTSHKGLSKVAYILGVSASSLKIPLSDSAWKMLTTIEKSKN